VTVWWQPTELIGLLAGAIGLTMAIPQALRIRRLGDHTGVSTTTWLLGYSSCAAWVGYGIRTASLSQVVANFIALLLHAWLISLLLKGTKWRLPALVGIPTIIIVFAYLGPHAAVATSLLLFALTQWPQAIRSVYAAIAHTPIPAVSTPTWLISLTAGSLWAAYGFFSERNLVVATSLIAVVATSIILIATTVANRRDNDTSLRPIPQP